MTTCTRLLEFDAAHRVLLHESKCSTLHGHRYKVEVTCGASRLDDIGRVIDFGQIKAIVGGWIDEYWDHTTIVNVHDLDLLAFCTGCATVHGKRRPYIMPDEPTAENMARLLLGVAQRLLHSERIGVVGIRIWETPNCYAEAVGTDILPEATRP